MPIRVLLVDDVPDVRLLLRVTLRVRAGFDVVGEASTGHEAITTADALKPDVIVLDLGLPDLAGNEVLARLRVVAPDAKVVVFTGTEMSDRARIRDAADGFVLKARDQAFLLDTLEAVVSAPFSASLDLPADPGSVRLARDFVTGRFHAWGCGDSTDAAALVTSELATNAIVHAASAVSITVRRRLGSIRIDVTDTGSRQPQPRVAGNEDEGGRGLALVAAMAGAWGVDPTRDGKLVWAELPCDDVMVPSPA